MRGGVYVFSVVFILLMSVSFVSAGLFCNIFGGTFCEESGRELRGELFQSASGSEEGPVRTPVVHYSFDSKTIGSYSKVKNEIPSLPWMLNDLGTPSFVQGIEGSALGLDEGDKVKVLHNPGLKDLLSNDKFALSFWIKDMESLTIQKRTSNSGFRLNSDQDGNLKFNTISEKNYPPVICSIDSSEWTNVIITAESGGSKSMYINGVECAESQEAGIFNSNPTNNVRIVGNFLGIDDIKMWNRDFSPENALAAFQGNDPSGIVVKYSFGELEGDFDSNVIIKNEIAKLPELLEESGTLSFVEGHDGTTGLNLKVEDGVQDKFKIKHSDGLKKLMVSNEVTVSFRVKGLKDLSIQKRTGDDGFVIFGNANRIKFKVGKKPAVVCDINPQIDPDIREEEIHVAVTARRNGDAIVYINGVECARGDAGPANLNAKNNFRGRGEVEYIDEIKVHGVVLSEDEIKREANDFIVQVATLKNTYNIGEQIKLTDPPNENPITGNVIRNNQLTDNQNIFEDITGIYDPGRNIIGEEGMIIGGRDLPTQELEFEGYIVELVSDPIIVEKTKLDVKASKNEREIKERPVLTAITFFRVFSTRKDDVSGKVKDYAKSLERNNEIVKDRIADELSGDLASTNPFSDFFNTITGNAVSDEELEVLKEFEVVFNGIVLDISAEEAEAIKGVSGVKSVTPNYEVYATLMDSVPLINADDVWQLDSNGENCIESGEECLTGKGVTIGILDSGIDYTHPDLGGCTTSEFLAGDCEKVVGGYDFINNDNNPMDDGGHGTHVAGTAAGKGVLNGVAPDAKLYAYKVLSGGSGSWDQIIAGVERSVDPNQDGDFSDKLDVISLSIGGYGNPDNPISTAIDNVVDAGVVAIIAAGNSGPDGDRVCRNQATGSINSICSPGTARKAITVGSVDKNDNIAGSSSRGPVRWTDEQGNVKYLIKPDVTAPGVLICAARWDNAYSGRECLDDEHAAISGTSMATPHVSGAVALIKQAHPDWTPGEIKMALRNTAEDIEEPVNTQGYGRIDVLEAVSLQGRPAIAEMETRGKLIEETIDIIGTASGYDFSSYTLFYGIGEDPSEWVEIVSSNTPAENGVLYENFDITPLEEGINYFKLIVENRFGEESEDRIIIENDNAYITFPTDDYFLTTEVPIDIIGRAKSVDFASYTLDYGIGKNPEEWIEIITSNNPVENGILYEDLDGNTLPLGEITLKLTVLDNNRRTSEDEVTIFNNNPNIKKLTDISKLYGSPDISEDYVVWLSYKLGDEYLVPDEVYIYDLNSKETRVIEELDGSVEIQTIIFGDKMIWFGDGWTEVYMYDLSTGEQKWITENIPPNAFHFFFWNYFYNNEVSEDSIVWQNSQGRIFSYNFLNDEIITINLDAHPAYKYPSISGNRIVWRDERTVVANDLFMYDLATDTEIQITAYDSMQYPIPIIYNNKIVWHDKRNGNYDIFTCDLEENVGDIIEWCNTLTPEGGLKQITDSNKNEIAVRLLEIGIIFNRRSQNGYDAYLYNFATEEETQLASNFIGYNSDISKDENKIVWEVWENKLDIFMYDFTTMEKTPITEAPGSQTESRISKKGVVWLQEPKGGESWDNYDIYMYEFPGEQICGNNIKEGDEECDGSGDSECPGRCNNECMCLPMPETQSKIVNNKDVDVSGNLHLSFQKKEDGEWIIKEILFDYNEEGEITIPANGLVKLDIGEDNLGNQVFAGFNNLDVNAEDSGEYRVYVSFEVGEQKFESSWEFDVV